MWGRNKGDASKNEDRNGFEPPAIKGEKGREAEKGGKKGVAWCQAGELVRES